MDILMPVLRILLIVALIIFVYRLVDYIRSNRAIEKTAIKIYTTADEQYNKRKTERERIYLEEGNIEEDTFFYKLDLMIERSGLRNRFKNLTTEIYLSLVAIIALVGFVLGNKIGGLLLGAAIITVAIVGSYGTIYILSGKNYEKIDSQIIPFVNLLENHAMSDSDIVNIMGSVYPYLEAPLKGYIEKFYDEAITSGDYTKAFMNLETRIESVRLKSIIRNIEKCSSHEANYDVIIEDERRSLKNYSKSKARKKEITIRGRSGISTCLLINGMLIYMFTFFSPKLINGLLNTPIGNIILLCWIVVLGVCGWYFIVIDKGEKS